MSDLSPGTTDTGFAELVTSRPPTQPQRFSHGALSWVIHSADIRYVRCGDHEIIRRIFVTLRDSQWQEVPPYEWSLEETRDGDTIRLNLTAHHRAEGIEFDWQGVFSVDLLSSELSLQLTGSVPAEMAVNRLGLVVLHPTDGLIGGLATIAGPSGEEILELTTENHPQRIVDGLPTGMTPPFTALTTTFVNGQSVRFHFSGELFEIEDQRNFGDTSFKSYCPPLAEGFPRTLAPGTQIEHAVTCRIPKELDTGDRDLALGSAGTLTLPPRRDGATMPELGAQLTATAEWRDSSGLSHVRADLDASSEVTELGAIQKQLRPGQHLELGLKLSAHDDANDDLINAVCEDSRMSRVLLMEAGRTIISRDVADRACRAMKRHGCRVPIATAVDGYFVEVNREVPVDVAGHGLAVAVCPTVHSGDVLTVTENVAALPDIIETARALFPGREITVSPLTLHLGPPPDPDVYTTVALPWFIGSLERVAHLNLPALTLGHDVLPDPTEQPELARAWESVLTLLNEARGAVKCATTALPRQLLHAITWETHPGEENLLIANLADHSQVVGLDSAPIEIRLLWSPSEFTSHDGQSSEFTVPAYGVVHARRRTA